jgi:hypothetical protein
MEVSATIVSDIDTEEAQGTPGAIQFATDGRGMFYMCPCGCGKEGYLAFTGRQRVRPDKRQWNGETWEWDGNREAPTLSPSVHHQLYCAGEYKTHWHGYLKKGLWKGS